MIPTDRRGSGERTLTLREGWQPPEPPARPDNSGGWTAWRLARRNILAALPRRLFRAHLAVARAPGFTSYLAGKPDLVRNVLCERPSTFPKHPLQGRAMRDLLGNSLFSATDEAWEKQKQALDPALLPLRLGGNFVDMRGAAEALIDRLAAQCATGPVEIEAETAHATADVIFRTLFSMPIRQGPAEEMFHAFRAYQQAAPFVRPAEILGLPSWLPRLGARSRRQRKAARTLRTLMRDLVKARMAEIRAGQAPDDVATALIRTLDPQHRSRAGRRQIVDQLTFLFLAGHETSAAMLAWALWLLAHRSDLQRRMRREMQAVSPDGSLRARDLGRLPLARDVLRETLRLYPPVPFLLRRAACPVSLLGTEIAEGSPVIVSPWHLGRHERIWDRPHDFDPDRWRTPNGKRGLRTAWIPFSAGPRVCPGLGFAMQEGLIMLASVVGGFDLSPAAEIPEPSAQLTLRSRTGIPLHLRPRDPDPR